MIGNYLEHHFQVRPITKCVMSLHLVTSVQEREPGYLCQKTAAGLQPGQLLLGCQGVGRLGPLLLLLWWRHTDTDTGGGWHHSPDCAQVGTNVAQTQGCNIQQCQPEQQVGLTQGPGLGRLAT